MLDLDSIDSREDFKYEMIYRAYKEPDFRRRLRSDPQAALGDALGGWDEEDVKLIVHETERDHLFFLINYHPDPATAAQIEISPTDNLEEVVVKKAWKDPQYRRELVADPEPKIREEQGVSLPAGIKLNVLEEDRNTLQLILPQSVSDQDKDDRATAELTEAQLEQVTGGGIFEWIASKLPPPRPPSGEGNTSYCGCTSSSGVRG